MTERIRDRCVRKSVGVVDRHLRGQPPLRVRRECNHVERARLMFPHMVARHDDRWPFEPGHAAPGNAQVDADDVTRSQHRPCGPHRRALRDPVR